MAKENIKLRVRVTLVFLAAVLTSLSGVAAFSAYADTSDWVWLPTTKLTQNRHSHSALQVELPGGVTGVMVIGGQIGWGLNATILNGSELYYPREKAERWHPGPSLTTPRLGNTATVLTTGPNKGKVLVAGGYQLNEGITSIKSCEILNPKSLDKGAPTDNMTVAREHHVAIELDNGHILAVGGGRYIKSDPKEILGSSERYDPTTNKWTPTTGSLKYPRTYATAVLLKTGKVLVVGGFTTGRKFPPYFPVLASCELYDPSPGKDSWDNAASLNHPRVLHTLTRMDDGRVLAAGGQDENGTLYRSYEIYDPKTNKWHCPTDKDPKKHLRLSRSGHTATLLPDGKVLLVGGYTSEIYDPEKDAWTFTRNTLEYPRTAHTVTLLKDDNSTVVAGGGSNISEKYGPP